ncbi:MAG: 3-oxoadipate enol-lactonase [Betaproteobacteria bacterium]|nr:3-oxoadipate enol-lactonase [Betaproteobacteria bacterium]
MTNHEMRWAMQKFKTSDGLDIAYVIDDYTDPWRRAETVILVHAAMGSSKRFYAWVPQLARDFRVARIDMRGHGASGIPGPHQLTPQRLVQDVIELADHIGAQRFHVVGSSAGSIVAEKVAIDYPERVLTLGAFAGTGGIKHGLQDQTTWVQKIGEKGLAAFLRDTIADRIDVKHVGAGFVDWFIAESARTPVEVLERFVPMMRGFEVLGDLHRISCPTLAVAPGADPIHTIDQYRVLKERISKCEFIVYEGLPHNITDAVPDRCAEDLKRFILKNR